MFKRVTIVALVVAAFVLLMAVPAMAFNGYRGDYTTSDYCSICHQVGQPGSAPKIFDRWAETAHAHAGQDGQGARLPYGSSCGGCHTSNYAPSKVVPTPTRTATTPSPTPTATNVSWGAVVPSPFPAQADGDVHYSENFVGCSSCHYGAATGSSPQYGNDPNDTAHMAPFANLANAEICGQCHSRYAYTVNTYAVATVPYVKLDGAGAPIPNPSPTSLLQPQYAIGYNPLGTAAGGWTPAGLGSVLNVQSPGWTPTPNPTATSAAGLQVYWQTPAPKPVPSGSPSWVDTVWQYRGHDGAANQYPDWKVEGHAEALSDLKAVMGPNPPASCLECHSADYRIAVEAGKTPPTGAQAKFGITCVGCHTPHDKGTAMGEWSEEFTPQLRTGSQDTLCVECHNGEIPEGTTAAPGTEIHHPMKEMIDGYGAIDVSAFPSVHKDKCVQCHMPPTTTSPTGGNHTFKIIEPEVANEAVPNPIVTNSPTPKMPYSSCSGAKGCHTRPNEPYGLYLQDTIEQRQTWTKAKVDEIWAALDVAAVNLGYADVDAAHEALMAIPQNQWTTAQRAFLSSFTNVEFVQSEGSFGLHNWDYSREIVNVAMSQAKIAQTGVVVRTPWVVTLKMSKSNVRAGTTVKFTGKVKTSKGVAGAGTVKIMRRWSGNWQVWLKGRLNSSGQFSISQKLTRTGTFRIRAFMPANSTSLSAYSSPSLKLNVR
jgi:nitrate reductase cytochrome c-type subunit